VNFNDFCTNMIIGLKFFCVIFSFLNFNSTSITIFFKFGALLSINCILQNDYDNIGYVNIGYGNIGYGNIGYGNIGYGNIGYGEQIESVQFVF
jgi:hypothetical protein